MSQPAAPPQPPQPLADTAASPTKVGEPAHEGAGADAAPLTDWAALLAEVDGLMRRTDDPASEPYRSKSEARRRLFAATSPAPPALVGARVAFRLGKTAVDTELPSAEAEAHLRNACEAFFPGLYDSTATALAGVDVEKAPVVVLSEALVQALASSADSEGAAVGEEALETLNLLGILWSGREELFRARAFLLAALQAHELLGQRLKEKQPAPAAAAAAAADAADAESGAAFRRPLQGAYTHTLFYLAQVYGALGDAAASAGYCYRTLAEQLEGEVMLDRLGWVANCLSLVDYYLTSQSDYKSAATCLEACDALLQREEADTAAAATAGAAATEERQDKLAFTRADVARRWAALYGQVLAAASELHEAGATGAEDAGSTAATTTSSTTSTAMDIRFPSLGIPASDGAAAAALPASPAAVRTYEAARPLFLQASRQLEAAKAYFKLEGFVTDHAHLQRELSRLYRHLSSFEADEKRCQAMYLRRAAALQPLLDQLNSEAYRALHKILAFELGEVYSALLEMKSARIEDKLEHDPGCRPSKAEALKCDEYCGQAIRAFEHFVGLYKTTQPRPEPEQQQEGEGKGEGAASTAAAGAEPASSPYSFEAKEDLPPFLRAHFHLARLHGRRHAYSSLVCMAPEAGHAARVEAAKRSLAAFEWLARFAPAQVAAWFGDGDKGEAGGAGVFAEELRMCREMAQTLPEKINRMHFQHVRFRA